MLLICLKLFMIFFGLFILFNIILRIYIFLSYLENILNIPFIKTNTLAFSILSRFILLNLLIGAPHVVEICCDAISY